MNKTISYKQIAILIFILGITFKVSALPSLISDKLEQSATFYIVLFMIIDILIGFLIFYTLKYDGINLLQEKLHPIIYKGIMLVFSIYFLAKLLLFFCGIVVFTEGQLFDNIDIYLIALTLIFPITYFASNGIRAIARTMEIMIFCIIIVIFINFTFVNANFNFWYNLPIFTEKFSTQIAESSQFLLWFGDCTPLLFVCLARHTKGKKLPLITAIGTILFTILCYTFMFAIYGNNTAYISNFAVKLSSYNIFSNDLGRMDWLGMIVWLSMATSYVSIYFWVCTESLTRIFKKPLFSKTITIICAILPLLIIRDTMKIISIARTPVALVIAIIGNLVLPILVFTLTSVIKNKGGKIEENLL